MHKCPAVHVTSHTSWTHITLTSPYFDELNMSGQTEILCVITLQEMKPWKLLPGSALQLAPVLLASAELLSLKTSPNPLRLLAQPPDFLSTLPPTSLMLPVDVCFHCKRKATWGWSYNMSEMERFSFFELNPKKAPFPEMVKFFHRMESFRATSTIFHRKICQTHDQIVVYRWM